MFEKLHELYSSIRIFLSPFLICLFIGVLCFAYINEPIGAYLLIAMSFVGILLGFLLLKKIKRKENPSDFMSKIYASPELDKKEKTKEVHSPD